MPQGFKPIAPSSTEVLQVAQYTLSILSQHNLQACLFGSIAKMLNGVDTGVGDKTPKDVDILVLNAQNMLETSLQLDQVEQGLKNLLVNSSPHRFFLVDSLVPGAMHRVLWFNLDAIPDERMTPTSGLSSQGSSRVTANLPVGTSRRPVGLKGKGKKPKSSLVASTTTPTTSSWGHRTPVPIHMEARRRCKVDILIPSMLGLSPIRFLKLPRYEPIGTPQFEVEQSLKSMAYLPLITLLLLKLRAWEDHSNPNRFVRDIEREKVPKDEEDIEELLMLCGEKGISLLDAREGEEQDQWMLGGFESVKDAERLVRKYVKMWPRARIAWKTLGLG